MNFKDQLVFIPENAKMMFHRYGAGTGLYLNVNNLWKNYKGEQQTNKYDAVVVPSLADDFAKLFKQGSYLHISGFDTQFYDKKRDKERAMLVITDYNISKKGFFGDD